jgi:DNA polymerase-3 subunit epsilon
MKKSQMNSFVALDFETANQYRSSVCSIGLVFVENGVVVDKYYELIKPIPNFYSYWNTKIHGLVAEDTQSAAEFPELWQDLSKRLKNLPLVAHNSVFDEGCLKAVLETYQLPLHQNPFFCTYRKSKALFPHLPNHRLPTVSKYLGFDLETHHNALADAEACAHIAMRVF